MFDAPGSDIRRIVVNGDVVQGKRTPIYERAPVQVSCMRDIRFLAGLIYTTPLAAEFPAPSAEAEPIAAASR